LTVRTILARLLAREYGLEEVSVDPRPRGYTNASYMVAARSGRFVLRVSWPGKPERQMVREERTLELLGRDAPDLPVPRLVPAGSGRRRVPWRVEGRLHACHLFRRLPGTVRYTWRGPCSRADARRAGAALARLHAALLGVPPPRAAPPLELLRRRLDRLARARAVPVWLRRQPEGGRIDGERAAFVARGRADLETAARLGWDRRTAAWIHGDFQLENLLFTDRRLTGILDFDGLRAGAHPLDLAFALFSVARDGRRDDRFRYDSRAWTAALRGYRESSPAVADALPRAARPLLRRLYCADQALMHLDCARRGLWRLGPGIGFLACWSTVVTRA
jgi:Ser/Thr protein kinase RdoA (MazF antagonist)